MRKEKLTTEITEVTEKSRSEKMRQQLLNPNPEHSARSEPERFSLWPLCALWCSFSSGQENDPIICAAQALVVPKADG
jgi:hypothetical protein